MRGEKVELAPEHAAALLEFAREHGRYWKAVLNECWMSGIYPPGVDGGPLQQVRNQYGPSWLVRFRLSSITGGQK